MGSKSPLSYRISCTRGAYSVDVTFCAKSMPLKLLTHNCHNSKCKNGAALLATLEESNVRRRSATQKSTSIHSVIIELKAHAILDLVVLQGNVVLVDVVPFLNSDLFPSSAALRGD